MTTLTLTIKELDRPDLASVQMEVGAEQATEKEYALAEAVRQYLLIPFEAAGVYITISDN